ncbi:uncharacterized protein LOC126375096 [Pectinophora gossypiella]|uniref:uncharacterized protein LOC126375096 n=1 Tax=Pectinophora gossypiella TaxID=13191 RepID=UPI00214E8EA5|nr:uncharacterized protein LOC126375096 [Pectinophora gossypiella]
MRCLKQLALECNDDVIARVINDDFYVDDLITGHDDKSTLLKTCDQVSKILKSGCLPLRKWLFNSEISNSPFDSKELTLGDNCQTKTLGLGWFSASDELHFSTMFVQDATRNNNITKRTILSIISQIYDPLGLLSPSIIIAKITLQKLWLCKTGWDDPVPQNIILSWKNYINKLPHLQTLRIPRHVIGENTNVNELHIFTDASQDAYGACAYVRSYIDDPLLVRVPIKTCLLCAKSKVAPVTTVSVPRLELNGALLGARLYKQIIKSLRITFDKVCFWSDSTIVLGWLRMSPSLLKTYVQNRVVEINEITNDLPWYHVAGSHNPSDLLTRGIQFDDLQSSDLWWHGPTFLREPNLNWIHEGVPNVNYDELPELKPIKTAMIRTTYSL